ncbi:glycosyl transferase family 1 [Thermosipho melanesiensis]|uniref:Glycosyl transferase, group 1 n=2 Tax=Thermosipho melanesiensis TaxID=46541 RepID=A6LNN9_THEM4|nr:mannosylglucosylglycerate synthase [Thermosipho melanesiensis]ABR31540.1 glycosyl transferase, group 1 [Thermosipho melanesiensis BI429]APT74579.1 glycosyl transferase family 1 [Thermosipho melanesiensis]OOC35284.1 glycosyl transferase family 1 [Thermosipho melanesiensis]OOC35503.1 glycosyl transferase family 1 [Thermosipho melanesiensis]OOC36539.1 glycosyl transferase family 1 [Thermosipho melanesiensis]
MNIALVHYRAGLMDGVSLEMEKWKKVLNKLGHNVDIVAGNNEKGVDIQIQSIGFENPKYEIINRNAFEKLENFTPDELINEIFKESEKIYIDIEPIFEKYDVIIPNNIWSIGAFLPSAIAFTKYAKNNANKVFIGHHHDFWWERKYFLNATTSKIIELLKEYCPPTAENIKHLVINTFAKHALFSRKKVDSVVVPNVMDFEAPAFVKKETNLKIRESYNISTGAIVLLQATRITERKAIELAIDLISNMQKKAKNYVGKLLYNGEKFTGEIVLAFSGMCEDDMYKYKLLDKAFKYGIRTIDLYPNVENKVWSFWDLYSIADAITYPSILEGWGNQLLEAIVAKKPIVLFEYEVFEKDIKPSGIEYVSLGNSYKLLENIVKVEEDIIEKAADKLFKILFDKESYEYTVNKNFEIGKKYYSLESLEKIIKNIL